VVPARHVARIGVVEMADAGEPALIRPNISMVI
jgi:hypothetical protein